MKKRKVSEDQEFCEENCEGIVGETLVELCKKGRRKKEQEKNEGMRKQAHSLRKATPEETR